MEAEAAHQIGAGDAVAASLAATPSQPHYTRFLNTIQVRCRSPTLNVKYEVEDLRAGQLRILWDGVDVSQQSIVASGLATPLVDQSGTYQQMIPAESRSGNLAITTEHDGGHTLQI